MQLRWTDKGQGVRESDRIESIRRKTRHEGVEAIRSELGVGHTQACSYPSAFHLLSSIFDTKRRAVVRCVAYSSQRPYAAIDGLLCTQQ